MKRSQIALLSVGGVLAGIVIVSVVSARMALSHGGIGFLDAESDAESVALAGASNITLTMDGGVLSGSMAGAGSIEYHGSVAAESVRVAGAARVERVR